MAQTVAAQSLPDLRERLRIYAIDGALLGAFMLSACAVVVALEHPDSGLHAWIGSAVVRRCLIGVAMGLTALGLIYSPWGKRSGAFMNPAMVLCFLRLGKLSWLDAVGYVLAQLAGAVLGVLVAVLLLPGRVGDPHVNYVATTPGGGVVSAFFAEFVLSFVMLSVVMSVNRVPRLAPYTGVFAAVLVALFISVEAPISGMSINPARSFGSAVWAGTWSSFWIYMVAPALGMLCGVELRRRLEARHERLCGKLSHDETTPCFVRCECLKGFEGNES